MRDSKVFGKTGLSFHPLGLGTHGHGHAFGGISKEESFSILSAILNSLPSSSCLFIDTAPRYGRGTVESWLGEYFQGTCNNIRIATKGGRHITLERDNQKDFSPSFLAYDLENSLKRLRQNRIFLYQMHNPNIETIKSGEMFNTLEGFRASGLIDWYGISINTPEEGVAVIEYCKDNNLQGLASIQLIYNVWSKQCYSELFSLCESTGVAIIAREVLARGFLTSKYKSEFDFKISSPAIQKLIKLYTEVKLLQKNSEFLEIVKEYGLVPASAALLFSITNPFINMTLVGMNRLQYFSEDWMPASAEIPYPLLNALSNLNDFYTLPSD